MKDDYELNHMVQDYIKDDIYNALLLSLGGSLESKENQIRRFTLKTKSKGHAQDKINFLKQLKPLCVKFMQLHNMYRDWTHLKGTPEWKERCKISGLIRAMWSEREQQTWGTF